jgi:DNA-binding transcriptional ArsR family regulator
MSGLLPSIPDTSAADGADPRVIGLDSEDADDLLSAMSSGTARDLLSALHEEPATPSAVADRAGTSLQNAQYHLDKLLEAGVIEVIDTAYSEKGREMKVYAPADKPLVVVAGDEEETSGLKTALASLLSGLGLLALVGVLIERLFGGGATPPSGVAAMEVSSGGPLPALSSPGVLFFLGGSAVLLAGFVGWYVRR